MEKCSCGCKDEKYEQLVAIVAEHQTEEGALISILHQAQELYGCLSLTVQKHLSELLHLPIAEIYSVATFYTQFHLQPKGKYNIQVCLGTACYVKGSGLILERLEQELGIKSGHTTEDKLFSLEICRCVGACGLAPVLMVNEDVHGRLLPDDVTRIIDQYKALPAGV